MLKNKKELTELLKPLCLSLSTNRERMLTITQEIENENGVPTGTTSDIIAGRIKIEEESEFLLFLLAKKINPNIINEFFTEKEINFYSTQKIENITITYPIELKCIRVANDQWIGASDSKFLMALRKAQLINYNANAQRTMQRIIRGEKETYKISVNKKAVNEIADMLSKNIFVPNTITLNIPEKSEWYYDDKKNTLYINKIDAFDISDGYHRYLAMAQLTEKNPEFNYPIELRLVSFPDNKIKQFIYQEDQKTKMKRIDSNSMNMSNPANLVIERLNADPMFNLKDKVQRNGGLINFSYLADGVSFIWFKGVKNASMEMILAVKSQLCGGVNALTENYPEFLSKRLDFKETLILTYGISQNWDTQTIKDKIDRAECLDKRIFAIRNTKKSMLNAIEKL